MNKKSPTDEALSREPVEQHVLDPSKVDPLCPEVDGVPWMPLGKVLIRKGFVTVREVMELLSLQAIEPHLRIGDLAVREGLCTSEEVRQALETQEHACLGSSLAIEVWPRARGGAA